MKKITLLLLVALISLFSLMSLAQDNVFVMQGGEPSIAHTASSRDNRSYEYHEQYTDPGAVVYHDGLFHMFRNGFLGWPAAVWIHHMVSEDGITWTQPSQEPVLLTEDVPFAEVAALASSVIVEEDGTWVGLAKADCRRFWTRRWHPQQIFAGLFESWIRGVLQ